MGTFRDVGYGGEGFMDRSSESYIALSLHYVKAQGPGSHSLQEGPLQTPEMKPPVSGF